MTDIEAIKNSEAYKTARTTQVAARWIGIASGLGAFILPGIMFNSVNHNQAGGLFMAAGASIQSLPIVFILLVIGVAGLIIGATSGAKARKILAGGYVQTEPVIDTSASEFSTDAMMGKLASPESGDEK